MWSNTIPFQLPGIDLYHAAFKLGELIAYEAAVQAGMGQDEVLNIKLSRIYCDTES
jgi:hypothetical protein